MLLYTVQGKKGLELVPGNGDLIGRRFLDGPGYPVTGLHGNGTRYGLIVDLQHDRRDR
ncbi:hypothetical protein D3C75_1269630 [compost metagenome]